MSFGPTEHSFLKHAHIVREALETFLLIQEKGSPRVVQCAMTEVINFAVCFSFPQVLGFPINLY